MLIVLQIWLTRVTWDISSIGCLRWPVFGTDRSRRGGRSTTNHHSKGVQCSLTGRSARIGWMFEKEVMQIALKIWYPLEHCVCWLIKSQNTLSPWIFVSGIDPKLAHLYRGLSWSSDGPQHKRIWMASTDGTHVNLKGWWERWFRHTRRRIDQTLRNCCIFFLFHILSPAR